MVRIIDNVALQELRTLRDMLRGEITKLSQPVVYGIDPDLPAGQLAKVLWRRCGRRKALVLRTKLARLSEADSARPNGSGAAHAD
jgi:hypothetical protein